MKREKISVSAVAAELGRMRVTTGYSLDELARQLVALDAETCLYEKGEVLVREGTRSKRVGIILEGAVHVQMNGMVGDPVLVNMISAGSFVGMPSILMSHDLYPVSSVAFTDCHILWLSVEKIRAWRRDPSSDLFFAAMCRQMSETMDDLLSRLSILSHPRLEDRVLTYLRHRCAKKGSRTIVVPGNAAHLAAYLCVHPVALSRAFSRLRKAGLVSNRRNVLTLLAEP